jgi:aryl-alcohol dehydrogenase-like predicted oxidoreductase
VAGARSAAQVVENAAAAGVVLSEGDLAEMETISRSVTARIDDNPVQWNF